MGKLLKTTFDNPEFESLIQREKVINIVQSEAKLTSE